MSMLSVVAVVDPVRVLTPAVQDKITTKIQEVGQPIRDNFLYVEVSD
jgi:hypothetical protein